MTVIEQWRAAMQPPQVVAFFEGLFDRAGVRVMDTGETFTCAHRGDRIDFAEGIDDDAVDFTAEITAEQAARLVDATRDGVLDEREQFRIMAVLATPATRGALRRPIIKSRVLRAILFRIGGAETPMHVVLAAPPGEAEASHTIAYEGGQWTVTPGIVGRAPHVFRLTVPDAIEYQRRMLAARKANRLGAWISFARWYGTLRKRVQAPAAG
jgi:hypothetical protein